MTPSLNAISYRTRIENETYTDLYDELDAKLSCKNAINEIEK